MNDMLFTLNEALQLVALGPVLFILFFLLVSVRNPQAVLLPSLYFLSLSCSFLLPLSSLWSPLQHSTVHNIIVIGDTMNIALAFLLVMQFLLGKMPPPLYWLVLAVPLVGGGTLLYGEILLQGESCLSEQYCLPPDAIRILYHIISSAVIMLLLIAVIRFTPRIHMADKLRTYKYWLVMALIMMHLLLLVVYLGQVAEMISPEHTLFIATMLRITFIYLILTSLFRVFDHQFELDATRVPTASRYMLSAEDREIAHNLEEMLANGQLHQDSGLNRARLAEKVGIGEHRLSRIINRSFGKSFSALLNGWRIEEAKQRLLEEDTAITKIAFEVGFNSIASFNRVFRENTGMSPTEFRASHSGE